MTPLERAARALFEYEPGPYGDCVEWAIEQPLGWRSCVDEVRLVLAAIREPSEGMVSAGSDADVSCGFYKVDSKECWNLMIDAMLEEG